MEPKIIDWNKVQYKGITLKVSPELIQDAYHGITITRTEFIQHIEEIYSKKISQMRIEKLTKLGI